MLLNSFKLNINNFHYYSLGLVLLTIPLPMMFNNIAIILFSFLSLLNIKKAKFKFNISDLFFPIIFLCSVISLVYSCNVTFGIKGIEKTLSYIVFFAFIPTLSIQKRQLFKLFKLFAYLNLLLIIYCFIIAVYNVFELESFYVFNPDNLVNENLFLYHRFSKPIGFHAIYFSVYLVFSSCILWYEIENIKNKKLHYLILFIFLIGIGLLQSFAVLIAYLLIIFVYFVFFNHKKVNRRYFVLMILLLIVSMSVFHKKANGFGEKILSYNIEENVHSKKWNSLNIRLAKWECAIEVVKNHMLFGTGVGCSQTLLNEMYLKKHFEIGYNKSFSTHNQYLHYAVEFGVLGLLIYFAFLIVGFYESFINNNFLMFSLIILLLICGITENILTLNKGIVFFSVFYYASKKFNNEKLSNEIE